jgi:hypothetical protein
LRAHGFRVERATGYHYDTRLPLLGETNLGRWLSRTSAFPLNRFGFNLILECVKTA